MYMKYVIINFLSLIVVKAWVFTDIRYNPRWAMDGESPDGEVFEINGADGENEVDGYPQERFNLIYPGTKWCGSGNIADDYDDLGSSKEADKCCREHDHCPDVILAGETRHNLTNTSFYSKLSCDCDQKFRVCLHKAGTSTANQIGKMYFDIIGTKCFRKDFPITGCAKRGGCWFKKKCIKYTYDKNGKMKYQWFDVPDYK